MVRARLTLLVCALAGLHAPPAAAGPGPRPHGNVLGDGLGLAQPPAPPSSAAVCPGPETVFGIDVSYYQGDIDWPAVAASGVYFAWVRVSHSLQFFDPKFPQNLAGARAAGIHTGVYQYFEPGEDPVAQADYLLENLGPMMPGDMPPMIDVESVDSVPPDQYVAAIHAWTDRVEAVTGMKPFIYTGYYYWNDHVASAEFADHPLWIANYSADCPLIPDAWDTWVAHQFCACGAIPGISGDVDSNNFNGDLATLEGYALGGAVCGDGKCVFGESPYDCITDCPPCGILSPEGGTIDNGDACYELYGNPEFWRTEAVGQGGSLVWTNATDYDEPSNYAIWRLFFSETGTYKLSLWIEQPFGESAQTIYHVHHAGGETPVPINQSIASGWVDLGEFQFDASTDHYVRVDDNTGEPNDAAISIVCDAMQISRTDLDEGGSSTGDATGGDADSNSGSSGAPDSTTGATTGELDPQTGSSTDATTTYGPLPHDWGEESSCGCRTTSPAGAGLLALALLGLTRRRRR